MRILRYCSLPTSSMGEGRADIIYLSTSLPAAKRYYSIALRLQTVRSLAGLAGRIMVFVGSAKGAEHIDQDRPGPRHK